MNEILEIINKIRGISKSIKDMSSLSPRFIEEYQRIMLFSSINNFDKSHWINYLCLGLGEEVGETLGLMKKRIHGLKQSNIKFHSFLEDLEFKRNLRGELGDVTWYLTNLILMQDMSLKEVMLANSKKVKLRVIKYCCKLSKKLN